MSLSKKENQVNHFGNKHLCKNVCKYDLEGNFIAEYPSIRTAAQELTTSESNITNCCRRKQKQTCGFIFKYKNPEFEFICQYDLEGNFIKEYISLSEAAYLNNISKSNISSVCKNNKPSAGNFIWRFKRYS